MQPSLNNPPIRVEDAPVPLSPGRLLLFATALLDCAIDLVLIVLFMLGLLVVRYFVLRMPIGNADLLGQMKVPVVIASELPFVLVGLWRLRRRGTLQGLLGRVDAKAVKEGLAAGFGFVLLS